VPYWWLLCIFKILIDAKLRSGKGGQKTELTVRRALRKLRSALDCKAIQEEVEEVEDDDDDDDDEDDE
jgi:predicted alpha-1,6-mannanase (GH76 family)